jgi:FKBP-type peptidyl-prolyl cis-trans isomerase FkpA
MKKICFAIIAMCLLLLQMSCSKKVECGYNDPQITSSSSEIAYMESYFTSNGITDVTLHSSGIYYKINNQGNGAQPNQCSTILVNYSAYRFGYGNAFDSFSDPAGIPFVLGNLILGVRKIMPLIKAGGSVTMYIPPSMAYGNEDIYNQSGTLILPANSYIKFDMSLIAVQ